MLQVCVWVDSTTDGTTGTDGTDGTTSTGGTDGKEKTPTSRSGPFCFEGEQGELPINGLQVGSHRFVALVGSFLPLLRPQSRFGDKLLIIRLFCLHI